VLHARRIREKEETNHNCKRSGKRRNRDMKMVLDEGGLYGRGNAKNEKYE